MQSMKQANEHQPSTPALAEHIDSQAAAWFARLRADSVTPEEKAAFAHWLQEAPAHQQAFDEICALWGDPLLRQALKAAAQPPSSPNDKAGQRFWYPLFMLACLALLSVVYNGLGVSS